MPDIVPESAFAEIFLSDTPLLDVRSPAEFQHGAFPNTTNIPLLDDAQRAAVGTRYKESGREAAIALGHELVDTQLRKELLERWQLYLSENPDALLYCFRGGLRSQISQQWLSEHGVEIPRIAGGYKALRRFLIDTTDNIAAQDKFIIVAGKTGSGKTHLINQLTASIDLEGCANHRGSAFGRRVKPQPGQIDFENQLAIDFLKLEHSRPHKIFLEDESHAIGSVSLPHALYESMKQAPIAVLEESMESRVSTILDDYIASNYHDFQQQAPEQCEELFSEFLLGSLNRIRKRLGEENFDVVAAAMQKALSSQRQQGNLSDHRTWIGILLREYYDPMYDYQLGKKSRRVVFRGSREEFLDWASHLQKAAD